MSAAGMTVRPAGRTAGRLQTIVVLVITSAVIGIIAFFVSGAGADDGVTRIELNGNVAPDAPRLGEVPPNFTGLTYDGTRVSLSDYAGKPLWLTFGGSWCVDCRVEAPDLQAAYAANKAAGLEVFGVFVAESAGDVKGFAERAGLTFPITVDERRVIAAAYRNMGFPTHYFIGRDGRIKEVRIGAMSRADMDRAVAAILN